MSERLYEPGIYAGANCPMCNHFMVVLKHGWVHWRTRKVACNACGHKFEFSPAPRGADEKSDE